LKELDNINSKNITTLTDVLEIIDNATEDANKIKRTIEDITKKDEVLILEDYRNIEEI
jgi:tetrahydromethanopterin S-methyltransferase subunit A